MMLKCVLFLSCCFAAAWSVPRRVRQYDLTIAEKYFDEFVTAHQKQYENEHEKQMRFGIFKDNLERINKQNIESKTAVFGINQFTDLTLDELKQTYTGLRHTPNDSHGDCWTVILVGEIPTNKSFDWRDQNKVTKVKDQKNCGSCWAFSAVGNLEGQYAIKYNKLKEFSEQQLVDCDKNDLGCDGGLMSSAFVWLRSSGGIESEKDYPYIGNDDDECKFDKAKVQTTVAKCIYPYIGKGNETMLEQALVYYGPLSIGVDATPFFNYEGGILDNCDGDVLYHGVLLVGYGEEDNTPYWIIKNSWGTNWGEKGYIRVKKNNNCCGLTGYITSVDLNLD